MMGSYSKRSVERISVVERCETGGKEGVKGKLSERRVKVLKLFNSRSSLSRGATRRRLLTSDADTTVDNNYEGKTVELSWSGSRLNCGSLFLPSVCLVRTRSPENAASARGWGGVTP
ncbi:hypothetical protein EVAR_27620_1 [Eumeta japonica]|uniref:Uncharacterized protein n=1 Tax=Eumeta variegata TaxID=151549 RepID=A0A4C1V1K8_EUMVA|nr:hypothetical protein EVAR_27620_1 [Eumeta japonica]